VNLLSGIQYGKKMSLVAYANSDSESDSENDESNEKSVEVTKKDDANATMFRNLPPPTSSTRSADESSLEVEDEEEVPVVAGKGRSSMQLPLPKNASLADSAKKSKDKSVKISVPSLASFDDDEDEPPQKKLKPTLGKLGLFAMLPPPKNSAGKITQRLLVPHSLTSQPAKSTEKKKVKPAAKLEGDSDDEDDDEDKGPLRFFSLGEESLPKPPPVTSTQRVQYTYQQYSTPNSGNENDAERIAELEREAIQIQMEENETDSPVPENCAEVPAVVDDEIMQRLQGRRGRRKEEINFIDVSVAQEMPKGNELKQLTEETTYEKPKGPAPTTQQRRKHQITYLAFQAKERELELKNQWAQNRLTRRQTQSKYGF